MQSVRSWYKRLMSCVLCLALIMGTALAELPITAHATTAEAQAGLAALQISALDGKTYSLSDFSEEYVVFLFGRSTCGNTKAMLNAAVGQRDKGVSVKIILMDVDASDSGLASLASEKSILASINSPYNNQQMWSIGRQAGAITASSVYLPGTFVLDANRNLVYSHFGPDVSGLKSTISSGSPIQQTYQFDMTYGQSEIRETLASLNAFRTGSDAWAWDSTNTTRVSYSGLSELTYDYGLERVAMQRAAEIAISYSHTRPNEDTCFSAYPPEAGGGGENIAAGFTTAAGVFVGWREDDEPYSGQGHRRNMLSSSYGYVGFGHVKFQGIDYWVQEFSPNPIDPAPTAANESLTRVSVQISPDYIATDKNYYTFTNQTGYNIADHSTLFVKTGETTALPGVSSAISVKDHWPQEDNTGYGLVALSSASNVHWKSSNTSVAVIENGAVKGVSEGNCLVYIDLSNIQIPVVVRNDGSRTGSNTDFGSVTENRTAATVTEAPKSKKLYYNGSAQELVTPGQASGGTMIYALNTSLNYPEDSAYSTAIPKATAAGTYYVFYKVLPDEDHYYLNSNGFSVTIYPGENGETGTPDSNSDQGTSDQSTGTDNTSGTGTSTGTSESPDSIPGLNCAWNTVGGKSYWYENGIKQGTYNDPQGVLGDGTVRGREIYDSATNGWYWLDAVYDGAKAVGKEVWMPYIYQNEADWDETTIRNIANESDVGMGDFVYQCIKNHTGKWVRYDGNGAMLKGWVTIEGDLAVIYPAQAGKTYYYDHQTGLMAKGYITIDGVTYHFDETSGVLDQ